MADSRVERAVRVYNEIWGYPAGRVLNWLIEHPTFTLAMIGVEIAAIEVLHG